MVCAPSIVRLVLVPLDSTRSDALGRPAVYVQPAHRAVPVSTTTGALERRAVLAPRVLHALRVAITQVHALRYQRGPVPPARHAPILSTEAGAVERPAVRVLPALRVQLVSTITDAWEHQVALA